MFTLEVLELFGCVFSVVFRSVVVSSTSAIDSLERLFHKCLVNGLYYVSNGTLLTHSHQIAIQVWPCLFTCDWQPWRQRWRKWTRWWRRRRSALRKQWASVAASTRHVTLTLSYNMLCYQQKKQESPADARVTRDSAVIPRWRLFQDGRQPPSWILLNRKWRHWIRRPRKPLPRTGHGVDRMHCLRDIRL